MPKKCFVDQQSIKISIELLLHPPVTTLRTVYFPIIIPFNENRSIRAYGTVPSYGMYLRKHGMEVNFLPFHFFKIRNPKFFKLYLTIGMNICLGAILGFVCMVWGKKSYTVAVGGTNARSVSLSTTVTDSAIEAVYTILGGKTGSLTNGAKALVMVAEASV